MKIISVSFAFIFALCFVALAAYPPELVVYMSFDGNTVTGDEVKDLSNYGNHGSILNDPAVVGGKRGDALDFTNDSIEIPISDSLSETKSAITMEAWVFARTLTLGDVFSRWDNQMNGITHFEIRDGGAVRFCMRNEADTSFVDFTTATAFPEGQWVHIAETYDGTTARIYFDGEEVGNIAGSDEMRDNGDVKIWIGSMYATDRWVNGLIDEVCIWSKALTPEELEKSIEGSLISAAVSGTGKLATAWGQIRSW